MEPVQRPPLEILVTCPTCRRDTTHEWAREVVRLPFLPLSRKQPAWEPTDEETSTAAPAVQAFVKELAEKYLPEGVAGFAGRHSTLIVLLVAMGGLFWMKWRQVQRVQAEAAPRPAAPAAVPSASTATEFECEYCHARFPDRIALGRHYEVCKARGSA